VSTVPAAAEPLAVVALPVVEPEVEADVPLAAVETAGALVLAAPVTLLAAALVAAVVGAVVAAPPDAGAVVLAGFGVSVALLLPQAARIAVPALPAMPPSNVRRFSRFPNNPSSPTVPLLLEAYPCPIPTREGIEKT
jgi:hypothetical protein